MACCDQLLEADEPFENYRYAQSGGESESDVSSSNVVDCDVASPRRVTFFDGIHDSTTSDEMPHSMVDAIDDLLQDCDEIEDRAKHNADNLNEILERLIYEQTTGIKNDLNKPQYDDSAPHKSVAHELEA